MSVPETVNYQHISGLLIQQHNDLILTETFSSPDIGTLELTMALQ
jgi:hypothetical protein